MYRVLMEVPRKLPVMTVSQAVLFPQAMLPLHIFEERYREMLNDSLESHRMMSISLAHKHEEPGHESFEEPHQIVGIGLVRVAVGRPDGTSNLILQGLCRARITKILEDKSYFEANLTPLDTVDKGSEVEVDALAAKVAELIAERNRFGSPVPAEIIKFLVGLNDADVLTDLVSFNLLKDADKQQQILETVDLRERLRCLIRFLQDEINHLKLLEKLKGTGGGENIGLN
ncbi:MAG: LON peptidase substrate-binding domain-containing protein [Verrucomicrobiae bacterium]|nr:LON peptidase substrate-binding domain-containing protein [Verrucomicrobiae bacterium]